MNYMISESLFNALLTYISQQPAVALFMELQRVMQSQQQAQQAKQAQQEEVKK